MKSKWKIFGFVLAGFLGIATFYFVSLASAKKQAQAVRCGSQLKSVSLAGRLWSNDHNDTLARSLLEMSNEVIHPKVLICSSDPRAAEHWEKLSANPYPWSWLTTNDITYEWIARGEPDTNVNRIVIRCPIHGFTGLADGSVLTADGRVAPGKGNPNSNP